MASEEDSMQVAGIPVFKWQPQSSYPDHHLLHGRIIIEYIASLKTSAKQSVICQLLSSYMMYSMSHGISNDIFEVSMYSV